MPMIDGKSVISIIPARGGSRGLPGKNIRKLVNKPLIGWTIESGVKSGFIDHLMVTTDSEEIATVARQHGAEVPFMRPEELATDDASSFDAVAHALAYYQDNGQYFDYTVLLQATSPLRTSSHIDEAFQLLREKKADSVISVSEADHSPLWMGTLPDNKNMDDFLAESRSRSTNRQVLPVYYRPNGAIYIVDTARMLKEGSLFLSSNVFAYVMNRESSVDIDDQFDFELAELLMRKAPL